MLTQRFFDTNQLVVFSNAVRTAHRTSFDLACSGTNSQVGNGSVFSFARTVRDNSGVASVFRHLDSSQSFGQRTDLVELDQDGVSDAFFDAFFQDTGYKIPSKDKGIMLSSGGAKEKASLLDAAQALVKNGYTIYATAGTAKFLNENNVKATAVGWPDEEHKDLPNVMQMIADHKFDLIVNIPKNHTKRELTNGYRIRRGAIDHNIPLITNARLASAFIEAFCTLSQDQLQIKSWQEYE